MLSYIGIGVVVIGLLLTFGNICSNACVTFIVIIGILLFALPMLFWKVEYEEKQELVSSYKLLPIFSNVYAIKTCDDKVIIKYIDSDQDNEVLIDTLGPWKEIVEISNSEELVINVYKRKVKKTWKSMPMLEDRYIEEINIPKGTLVS